MASHQLGKAVGILLKFEQQTADMLDDVRAFHAPSECAGLVIQGEARRFRQVRRHACHVAGVKNIAQLRREVKRACPTWDRYNWHRLGIQSI